MKTRRPLAPSLFFSAVFASGLAFGGAAVALRAELPPISPGETIVFSDDFVDNRHSWTAIVSTDLSSPGTVNQARIVDSVWSPAEPGGESIKSTVESVHVFATPLDLADGPVSVYLSARVDEPRGGDGNRFNVALHEAKRASFASLNIRPGMNTFVDYRGDAAKAVSAKMPAVRFTEGVCRRLKFTVAASWNVDGFIGRIEAFLYDEDARRYVSLGSADESVIFKTGRLEQIALVARNGVSGFAYIDSVAVTRAKR